MFFNYVYKKKQSEPVKESMDSMQNMVKYYQTRKKIVHQDTRLIQDEFDVDRALRMSFKLQDYTEDKMNKLDS